MNIRFQSPRRWGGVGLASTTFNASRIISPSFNPLGGGAGSGSKHMQKAMEQISASGFQSPRRWGGVGLGRTLLRPATASPLTCCLFCFNPLGGGAGSGSPYFAMSRWRGVLSFQSPRRWGGVGLRESATITMTRWRFRVLSFQSPRRWGGVGLIRSTATDTVQAPRPVSIPSEVGRGRAHPQTRPRYVSRLLACFNPLGGGAGSGSLSVLTRRGREQHHVSIPSEVGRGRAHQGP